MDYAKTDFLYLKDYFLIPVGNVSRVVQAGSDLVVTLTNKDAMIFNGVLLAQVKYVSSTDFVL